jgi:hypothetical protein
MSKDTTLTLHATFVADERVRYRGLYTGARCELPNGQVVETRGRRTPLYDLARKLDELGFGDWKLQAYTPTGTPSLRGKVSVMAGLTVEESDKGGLKRRKYRPFPGGGRVTQRDFGPEATEPPENGETRLSESLPDEKAA